VRPVVSGHARTAAAEVQVGGVRTTHSTTPIEAVATHIEERGIAVNPAASQS